MPRDELGIASMPRGKYGAARRGSMVRCVEGSLSAMKVNPPRSIIAQKFELVTGLQKF
jgi:hypothetical protein